MPIYEYNCKRCGVFEVTQRITESPLTTCPTCNGDVHRLISHTSFVLKGSGWYITDYARSNGKSKSTSDSGAEASNGSSGDKASAPSSDVAKSSAAGESGKTSSDRGSAAKSAD